MKRCEHGKRDRYVCKECNGNGFCEHGKYRSRCKKCGGGSICPHGKLRTYCKNCGGGCICEHGKVRNHCKKCGCYYRLVKGGFTFEEIKTIGSAKVCQFPHCRIESDSLHSDHAHASGELNVESYRGEVCPGHNRMLADLDAHPEWASLEALEYMARRPYTRLAKHPRLC